MIALGFIPRQLWPPARISALHDANVPSGKEFRSGAGKQKPALQPRWSVESAKGSSWDARTHTKVKGSGKSH
jgi:hypothetical protein